MGNIEYYKLLSVIMGVSSAVMLILTLILWFKLNIKRDFAVLSGSEAKKDIEKIRKEAQAGTVQADLRMKRQGAAISWNTSERLENEDSTTLSEKLRGLSQAGNNKAAYLNQYQSISQIDPNQTVLLGQSSADAAVSFGGASEATTVLGAETSDATTVLGADVSNGTTVLGAAPYGTPTGGVVPGTANVPGAAAPLMVAPSDSKKDNRNEAAISNAGFVIEREERT